MFANATHCPTAQVVAGFQQKVKIWHGLDVSKQETALPMYALTTLPAVILDSSPVSLHIEIVLSIAKLRSLASWDHLFKLLLCGCRKMQTGVQTTGEGTLCPIPSMSVFVISLKAFLLIYKPPTTFYNELNLNPSTALKTLENKVVLFLQTSELYFHPYEYGMKYCSKKKNKKPTYSR